MAIPRYRIPISRLMEEWDPKLRMEGLRRERPPVLYSKIVGKSEPWIKDPSAIDGFWEIACKFNEAVAHWSSQQEKPLPR